MFDPVSPQVDLPALERELCERWRERRTFQASLAHRQGAPRWVFFEGPPTANGRPGTHHILSRAYKDVFGRYRTMRGYYVERKAGWDTHGLPVELEVEKELGISGKQQIEEYGIEAFNRRCRESVFRYVAEWEKFSERMAFWQDYENAYWTLDSSYIQSVWWALTQIWNRGLIYKGFRVAPYCPRCATPLSSHELGLGYRDDVPDPSVYVRFRTREDPDTSFLAWTTTPWTLPGNVALAVGEEIDYVKVRVPVGEAGGFEHLILAEARLSILEGPYEVVRRMPGRDLLDMEYEPLFPYLIPEQRAFFVVGAGFVSTDDGTGIVHTAAAYGADDLRLCQEKGIPIRHVVDLRGRFRPEVEPFAGQFVKDADPAIIDDLRQRGLLYRAETIRHTYPFCWRCSTPLIYYALDSWYIATSRVKDTLIKANQETNWVPEHIKNGRMGDWLQNNVDWAISRTRYWGTPLPFWICDACQAARCVASAAEIGLEPAADLHRPYIDQVTLVCDDCGGTMRRVPEVLDCWFDSGAMPFAQRGYPHQGVDEFEAAPVADFIAEAVDQTRGWFYSLLAISSLLFGRNAYRNVICLGLLVDERGQKMSKSRANAMDPNYVFDTFGADAVRWLFFTAQVGENLRLGKGPLQEVVRRFLLTLWNVYSFFVTYARIDGFRPGAEPEVPLAERPVLDRWIISRIDDVAANAVEKMDAYDVNAAARPIEQLVDDLSNWYVRRSRRRFWKSESDVDKLAAYQTLHYVLTTLARMLAPFTPFLAEAIYVNLTDEASVHLADFPDAGRAGWNPELELQMERARAAVERGLAARDAARIKVRQPLNRISVPGEPLDPEIAAIVRDELNVKSIFFGGEEVELDTEITPELRLEGLAREWIRSIQDHRKRSGLNIEDRIELWWEASGLAAESIAAYQDRIAGEVLAVAVRPGRPDGLDGASIQLAGEPAWIGLRRYAAR